MEKKNFKSAILPMLKNGIRREKLRKNNKK
jgi:hypothetical protein